MRSRLVAACLAVLLALVVGSCGESKPTHAELRAKRVDEPVRRDSVSARVGDVRLVGVHIERPAGVHAKGSNSPLLLTLANDGAPDHLVAVSSVDSRSVVQRTGHQPPAQRIGIRLSASGVVAMQHVDGLHLELVGLKRELRRRTFVPVTFRFEEAGPVTVEVFVSGSEHEVSPGPSSSDGQ
ncbi:copper chaperone PCu(A)C [Nocardioides panacis]|uniref:Copper chaperone PCu(A)C n=1 Tax=Nocardioides panacis TaxID=2849501 RepID=A0A975XYJ5_9ACTN|nr:copper chaperone PCu(A)C [Nocardioides panacis]QWZ06425.1 copper chaperone PCu(A)C [Nocardioides panacis]